MQQLKSQLTEFKNNEIELKLNKNDLEYRRKDFERMEQMSISRNKKLCADIKALEDKLIECKKENFEEKCQHVMNKVSMFMAYRFIFRIRLFTISISRWKRKETRFV